MARKKRNAGDNPDPDASQSKRPRGNLRFAGYEEHHVFGFEPDFRQYALSVGVDIPDRLRSMEYSYSKGEGDPTVGREEDKFTRKYQKRYWSVPMYEFFNSGPGFDEEGWKAVRPLGIGGTGMAVLWERSDESNDQSIIPSKVSSTLPGEVFSPSLTIRHCFAEYGH